MEKKSGDDEIAEEVRAMAASSASASRKKRMSSAAAADGAYLCDDIIDGILAFLPARTAVACTALSKRHRGLIRSAEFRSLHFRLGAPLPRPHIAYIATAPLRNKRARGHVSEFHGFHVAGAGISGDAPPMGALFGERHFGDRYVYTCNGVVLLATDEYSPRGRCVLWNPAVADVVREFAVPADPSTEEQNVQASSVPQGFTLELLATGIRTHRRATEVKTRVIDGDKPRWSHGGIQSHQESLYIDGTVYLLDVGKSMILAFDVDDEIVTTIRLPGKRDRGWPRHSRSRLMEMHGRLCLATNFGNRHRAGVWLLAADRRQWECRCVVNLQGSVYYHDDKGDMYDCSIAGVWDGGGVLAVYIQGFTVGNNRLCLYQSATEEMVFHAKLPCDLVPDVSDYALCWGYRPTLVSPQSIVELSQDEERRRNNAADIMAALKPIHDKDSRDGHREILDTMSFMEFLVSIMRKLQDDIQDVMKLPLLESIDSDVVSENDSEDWEEVERRRLMLDFEIISDSD